MTKKDSVDLYVNLNKLGNLSGVKFAYAVSRNIALLKPEIEALDKSMEISEEFKKFEDLRMEVVKKFAKKDEKGEPVSVNNNYVLANQADFDIAFDVLKSEHKEIWENRLKQIEEYNELLKTDSSVVLHKVSLSDIPNNITVTQMYSISAIVDESVPSPYPAQ